MANILITGGTGLVGKHLTNLLLEKGHQVTILSRKPTPHNNIKGLSFARWNIEEQEIDKRVFEKADHIIHLAGAGVMDKSWSEKYKKEIVDSRTKSSALLLKSLTENPNHIISIASASAIGWYGKDDPAQPAKAFIESDPPDPGFLGETCRLWEESIEPAQAMNIRLVKLRIGIVLSNEGGALAEFKKPIRFGIAAILGSGNQVVSWIHIDDLCRMFLFALENNVLKGSYNAVAPAPVTNKELMLLLAKKIRGNFSIPVHVPAFAIKLALGGRSIEVLKSTRVSNAKIKTSGFEFKYPTIDAALSDLSENKKSR